MSDAIYSKTTHGYEVSVRSFFVPEESDPQASHYFFAYVVRIKNVSGRPAQLVSRYWIIKDAWGRVEEVRGPGVIGQQPFLPVGEHFEYNSFCPLRTSVGTMEGRYQMVTQEGFPFEIDIPEFRLAEPKSFN